MGRSVVTLRDRLLIYFTRNPDEDLTMQDIRDKWGIAVAGSTYTQLRRMANSGLIEWERGARWGLPSVVRAGPQLKALIGHGV